MSKPNSRKTDGISRRELLTRTAAVAAAAMVSRQVLVPRHVLGGEGHVVPSEKLLVAGVGVGGQGMQNMEALMAYPEVQVVAVCDVNREGGGYLSWNWTQGKEQRLCGREPARKNVDAFYAKQGRKSQCKAYADYREMFDKEKFDGVMVATPDHSHAVVTMAALKRGKHVYCEKPLTYSVSEARQVAEAARKAKVATQMGNHGQASEEARVTCEMIWAGAIGGVHEVQAWSPARFWPWPAWEGRPKDTPPVPDGFDWDLWLGPAPERPYHPTYHPWTWRNWWDFGTGIFGDLGCHKLSTVFKALKLGHPTSVEASSTKTDGEIYPLGVLARFEFPARGDMPPLVLNWYDGGLQPPTPKDLEPSRRKGDVIYLGDKGTMMGHRVIPEKAMQKVGRPPKVLARSVGHYKEWVDACRGGQPAGSNFVDHAGLLTEVCMLGNVALRAGKRIEWDGAAMKITNDPSANRFLQREYRKGWSL